MISVCQGVETLDTKDADLKDLNNPWGSKYSDSMCLEIINMFSQGKTRSQFCAKHTISNNTFEAWRKKHILFARACEVAHEAARSYFDALRDAHLVNEIDLENKSMTGINHALFNRMYNTRFNIPDKRAVTVKALGRAKDERAMLKSIMKAVSDGELTPDEAQKLASLIDISLKIKTTQELEDRLNILEKAQTTGFHDNAFEEIESE